MKAVTRGAWIRFVQAALVAAALIAVPGRGFAQDTDGDGMSNAYENFFFLNPTNPADALLDYDGDTLTNRYEAAKWTDPWTEDTDMDGWWDNWDSDPLSRAVFYWGAAELTQAQLEYAASDVLYLHRARAVLVERLAREGRTELARACFDFLPARAQLDLLGWEEPNDIFHH